LLGIKARYIYSFIIVAVLCIFACNTGSKISGGKGKKFVILYRELKGSSWLDTDLKNVLNRSEVIVLDPDNNGFIFRDTSAISRVDDAAFDKIEIFERIRHNRDSLLHYFDLVEVSFIENGMYVKSEFGDKYKLYKLTEAENDLYNAEFFIISGKDTTAYSEELASGEKDIPVFKKLKY
jgi:hypothetical protein